MGIRGTQVAKETASIVIKDDSFNSITAAIAHGREIFRNIQKFVIYLVSCNLSEMLIVTGVGFYSPASALLPLQILFLNMVTDVFPALALGVGQGDKSVMSRPPRNPAQPIIGKTTWVLIGLYAAVISFSVVAAVWYCKQVITTDAIVENNVAFITLAFAQLFHVFNMSSPVSAFVNNEITRNKYIWFAIGICSGLIALVYALPATRLILGLAVLPWKVWMVCLFGALLPVIVIQGAKVILGKRKVRIPPFNPTYTHVQPAN